MRNERANDCLHMKQQAARIKRGNWSNRITDEFRLSA